MTRSVDDLAADVRRVFPKFTRTEWTPEFEDGTHYFIGCTPKQVEEAEAADAALSELVALVGTLTQQRDEARHEADYQCRQVTSILVRALAAEAALADMRKLADDRLSLMKAQEEGYEAALADMRRALERIRRNAQSWHGPELDNGHARALRL